MSVFLFETSIFSNKILFLVSAAAIQYDILIYMIDDKLSTIGVLITIILHTTRIILITILHNSVPTNFGKSNSLISPGFQGAILKNSHV